ncbi:hypothetical protein DPMN_002954 [Dreissena polymorpha]|uniref:Uncharacterized protein n=1 Tax=Dreissena polymorpha TaxID=45954 RepID=A0A9D4MMB5_DREPO|nr:hypothetical protein DPMN_002954 [Dreissena polymorpha]
MAPDGRKDGRTDNAKTIALRLWLRIINRGVKYGGGNNGRRGSERGFLGRAGRGYNRGGGNNMLKKNGGRWYEGGKCGRGGNTGGLCGGVYCGRGSSYVKKKWWEVVDGGEGGIMWGRGRGRGGWGGGERGVGWGVRGGNNMFKKNVLELSSDNHLVDGPTDNHLVDRPSDRLT